MKLVIGLGNPGEKYENNRHNVGHMAVDALASRMVNGQWLMDNKLHSLIINHQPLAILAKPISFMNESGSFVKKLINHYSLDISHLYVVHDDLDIALGGYKIQKGKGPKLHKGILSIERQLGSDEFWRVRIGVDNRIGDKTPGEEYVLQDFTEEEKEELKKVIDKVAQDILSL